ncbi:MAG TPA: carboxylesterase family protein [Actinophytocola sp.]|uniref:carboxylesterase/lipase family protein n=1 Tax=Actinophytocola sp. TaxID=1872138 RepID=UPI002DBF0FE4|nr:carboxylesterase family protein [Actinophytocola sp.]HEU5473621.1 carboxylesterase family protein [Actinophytocola sp.]
MIGLVVASLVGSTATVAAEPVRPPDLVITDRGPVRGVVQDDFRLFQGIPFAEPPVGELRWRAPRPAPRWTEPLDATAPRRPCAQPSSGGFPPVVNEDCLYLNVTTPTTRGHDRLPVMVWLHGGGFLNGTGAGFDARKLAVEGGVVLVTTNYRLGALGFLAHPELTGERPGIQSGNYGLEDQRAALRWVRGNAGAFGGDPHNVTVFGESAGGGSICAHLTSPAAAGLFHRAVSQSFSCAIPLVTGQQAEADGIAFAARAGCADLPCLRTKPAGDLLAAWTGGGLVIGGREQPLQPAEALRTDRFHHVPLLLGNNLDERRHFVGLQFDATGRPVPADQYGPLLRALYGPAAEHILQRYPLSRFATPSIALATVQTDAGFAVSTCDHLTSYRLATARPRPVPVYAYQFVDRTAPPLVDVPDFDEGAAHTVELPFLFPNLFGPPLNPQQQQLSTTMVKYWTNFAHHANPNGPHLPQWPRFRSSDDVLALGLGPAGIRPIDIAEASNCAFWESLPTA